MQRKFEMRSCGEWRSPISIDLVTSSAGRVLDLLVDGANVCTCELRPAEGGRTTIVHHGSGREILPEPYDARTGINEYGGSCSVLVDDIVYFSNFGDRRLWRAPLSGPPEPITPRSNDWYGDLVFDRVRHRVICIREDNEGDAGQGNTLVSVDAAGREPVQRLFSGPDFLASPTLGGDSTRLAWISWNHPHMPFDESQLWVADINAEGTLVDPCCLVRNAGEYVSQPRWAPDGSLYFLSDRSGWINLYRVAEDGDAVPVCPLDAEFGEPLWLLGEKSYTFSSATQIIATFYQQGTAKLGRINTETGALDVLSAGYAQVEKVTSGDGRTWFLGARVDRPLDLYSLDTETEDEVHHPLFDSKGVDPATLSRPRFVEFEGATGKPTYAFYYPPANPSFCAPDEEKPPLLVTAHGGPTYRHSSALMLGVQFWTSRGFAYLDVNYGGSTGFGRAYRERLQGQWGIVDVEDCARGAEYAQERFGLDPERTAIRGPSAGGFTTFAALAFTDRFRAGASWFGISDLRAFRNDTHRFESHYAETLLGTGAQYDRACRERSPLNHVDQIDAPMAIFQGEDDRIVPPDQSERIAARLENRGIPVVYRCYKGEGHGFRKKDTLADIYRNELDFYASVFAFKPADY